MSDSGLLRVNVLRLKCVLFDHCCGLLWRPANRPSIVSEHLFLGMGNCLWNDQKYQLDILLRERGRVYLFSVFSFSPLLG